MIPQPFIEEVQSKTDIVELISSYIPLKRTGRNFKALCPFHGEKTPSFIVSSQKQIFHCFGCGEGGGVFQFLALMEKVSFPEAVEMLAKKLGLNIPYQETKTDRTRTVIYEAMNEAVSFFHNNLIKGENYQHIRDYLNKRGVGEQTISKFSIGYAFGNNSLLDHMRRAGFTIEILEKASLVTATKNGFRDLFCNRITFPICDARSRTIGFGARIYKEATDSPKYINSLENILYSKREHLFGLNFSKEDIVKEDSVIIVEGYLDMIIPFMKGIKNIVASLGTALTQEQIHLVKRYTSCVIFMYDSDKAGQNATLRSLDLLLENDLKVKVANLPSGYDPDSLIREKGKECFLKFVNECQDFFDYKLGILKNIYDIDSIEGKTKIAKELLSTMDKLNSEIEKYEYVKKLSASLQVKEEIIIAEFQNNFYKNKNFRKQSLAAPGAYNERSLTDKDPLSVTEKIIFKFVLASPKAFLLVKKNLKEEYFSSYLARKTISFLFNAYSGNEHSLQEILRTAGDKEISSFISKILMDEDIPMDKNLFKESLFKLRKKGIPHIRTRLKGEIKEAENKGDKAKLKELINEYGRMNSEARDG